MHVEDLQCATLNIIDNNFTREDIFGSRSFIDHFIVNRNVLYSNVKVLYNGNNLSDHNPVVIQTSHHIMHTDTKVFKYRIMDWDKAKEDDISRYKDLLDYYLRQFDIPLCVTNCENLFCDSHNDILIDKINEFLEIMEYCAEFTILTRIVSNEPKGMPG